MKPSQEKTSDGSKTNCDAPAGTVDPLAQVLKWVLDGASEQDIQEAIRAHFPEKESEALIVATMRHLETVADRKPRLLFGWCFEATRELYRRMVEIGDYPGALRAVKQTADLAKRVAAKDADNAKGDDLDLDEMLS